VTTPLSPLALHSRVKDALEALGIRNLLLAIHDPAFPSRAGEDVGRGSPYSEGGRDFLAFVRELGFTGVQLGPQGTTSRANPSPYDGTLFSRNPLSISLARLAGPDWGGLLSLPTLEGLVAGRPGPVERVPYPYVFDGQRRALGEAHQAFRRRLEGGDTTLEPLARGLAAFRRANADWLERDAFYEILEAAQGGRDFRRWTYAEGEPHADRRLYDPPPGEEGQATVRRTFLREAHAPDLEAYAFSQFVFHEQHRRLRAELGALGLRLYGDLQAGLSLRDAWFARGFLLPGYVMGAPPSRTNPEGQPWNYGLLDPARYFEPWPDPVRREGPALRFLRARVAKMFGEFDAVRVDHPHGLVCPWVYRADAADPTRACQGGARLFSAPDLPDHPELARYAIARPDQVEPSRPRHDDHWVRALEEEQVDRYGIPFTVIADVAQRAGGSIRDVACEILSTQPYPLGRVMARHGLGRFRVTQKADLGRADDVYRGENASPEDWIMLGNHDTPSIWAVADEWMEEGTSRAQADYLASRLLGPGEDREAWSARVASDLGALVEARFADLFVGPARNVQVFFTDLLGIRQRYNRPGRVDSENWSLRVAPSFRADYPARRRAGQALHLPRALARALRARGPGFAGAHASLLDDLEAAAVDS
jgi:4-alpha-glucanotransferase